MPASRRAPHIALPGEPLYCPSGHKLPNDLWSIGNDVVVIYSRRCVFRYPPGNAGICGAVICVVKLADDTRVGIEVTSSEAHDMEKMGTEETLQFLNLRWARTADPTRTPHASPPAAGVKP